MKESTKLELLSLKNYVRVVMQVLEEDIKGNLNGIVDSTSVSERFQYFGVANSLKDYHDTLGRFTNNIDDMVEIIIRGW